MTQPSSPTTRGAAPSLRDDREVPLGLHRATAWAWRLIVLAGAGWVLMKVLAPISAVIIGLLVAILLTALLSPLVSVLTRRTFLGRAASATVTLLGFIAVVVGMFYLSGSQLATSFKDIQGKAVSGFQQPTAWATRTFGLGDTAIDKAAGDLLGRLQQNTGSVVSGAMTGLSSASTFVSGIFICLFVLFFLLLGGEKVWRWVVGLLPRGARIPTHEAFRRGWRALGYYGRTQVLVAAVDAFGISLGMVALGLGEYAVPIWLIVFLFSFIPIVGAIASGALACLLVLVLEGMWPAVIMLGIVLVVQQVEGNVLNPLLMGKAVELHPLAIFLGVAVGATLYGIVGALFAIPVLAFVNATWCYLANRDPAPDLAPDALAWRSFGMGEPNQTPADSDTGEIATGSAATPAGKSD